MSTEQEQNADATAAKVGALAGLYVTGSLTRQQFVDAFVLVVYAAKIKAARLAEVALFRWSLGNWDSPIPPVGIVPGSEVLQPLEMAAETLAEPSEVPMPEVMPEDVPERTTREIARGALSFTSGVELVNRAERVSADAAKESGRETTQERMKREGIPAWRWVAREDACPVCRKRHGRVYRISVTFRDHFGCNCNLEPATQAEIELSERKRAAAKRRNEGKNHDAASRDTAAA
jgi:hypothetical protein